MSTVELKPIDGRKSFYGKAQVIFDKGEAFLKSYNTIVCKVDADGVVHRFWDDWSATTGRHISAFVKVFADINVTPNKAWWNSLEVEKA